MVSKLIIGSVCLIAVGIVLVVVGNPSLRFVTGTPTSTSFTTFTRFTFTGNFTFTGGTFPGNFTRGPGAVAGSGRVTTAALESLAGIALIGAGLVLEIFTIFIGPRPAAPAV
jgi:hypothetical protein